MPKLTVTQEERLEGFLEKLHVLARSAEISHAAEQELIDELRAFLAMAREREQFHENRQAILKRLINIPPLGVYQHYKGGFYTVTGYARYHDTDWPMVLYVSHDHGGVSVRPAVGHAHDRDGWSTALPNGDERFRYIGPQLL